MIAAARMLCGMNTPSTKQAAEVIIVGGGPAGLALACALDAAGIAPLVLEQQPIEPLRAPAEDGRDIALTHRSRRVLTGLGVWQRLPEADVSPLKEARVVDDGAAPELTIAPRGASEGPLGWLVPNWCIRRAALEEFEQRGLRLECGAKVTRFERGAGSVEYLVPPECRDGGSLDPAAGQSDFP